MPRLKSNRAFVLLYAVLVASVVLAIGFSLANIITKQIILSSLGQSSRIAYYAADGGRDCGLFWANFAEVITGDPFGISTPAHCDGVDLPVAQESVSPEADLLSLYGITLPANTYTAFSLGPISLSFDNQKACSRVTIFSFEPGAVEANYRTIVLSRGFNTECSVSTSHRIVSRTVINVSTW